MNILPGSIGLSRTNSININGSNLIPIMSSNSSNNNLNFLNNREQIQRELFNKEVIQPQINIRSIILPNINPPFV